MYQQWNIPNNLRLKAEPHHGMQLSHRKPPKVQWRIHCSPPMCREVILRLEMAINMDYEGCYDNNLSNLYTYVENLQHGICNVSIGRPGDQAFSIYIYESIIIFLNFSFFLSYYVVHIVNIKFRDSYIISIELPCIN